MPQAYSIAPLGESFHRRSDDATDLVQSAPDAIVVNSTPAARAFQRATHALPIVFVAIADPVHTGVVLSLAHPGGNITGFTNFEASMGGKWLELLKEIAPRTTRVALIFNPDTHSGQFFQSLEAEGPSLGIETVQTPVHNEAEIERAVASFNEEANVGLVAMPDIFTTAHRDLIISLATKYRLPQSLGSVPLPQAAGLCLTALTCPISSGEPHLTSIAS